MQPTSKTARPWLAPLIIILVLIIFTMYKLYPGKPTDKDSAQTTTSTTQSSTQNTTPEKITGEFQWQSSLYQNKYEQFLEKTWNPITNSVLGGFNTKLLLTEKQTTDCKLSKPTTQYLRTEGGLCEVGYWLEINSKPPKEINTLAKLKQTFAPVDSEAKAASFVAITRFVVIDSNGIISGHTLPVSDGYLVQALHYNRCEEAVRTEEIYHVKRDGTVDLVAIKPNNITPCSP